MSADTDAYREIAKKAVEALVEDRGLDSAFSFDAIWQYAPQDAVPSVNRPGLARTLINAGYLGPTGGTARTVTAGRRSSVVREYRPGLHFRGHEQNESAHGAQATALQVSDDLRRLEGLLETEGLLTTVRELANLYLALKVSPLVILTGFSGIGKSWLPRLFAKYTGSSFNLISVKPQWSENADLFGYTPSLSPSTFVRGDFTRAIEEASAPQAGEGPRPHIVLLDEMNLAPVEHYFSDFLSVAETRRREAGTLVTDRLPLELPPPLAVDTADPYEQLRSLGLPANVRVIGTANLDETVRQFSPKVLDRAFTIEFSDVDLATFPDPPPIDDETGALSLGRRIVDPNNPVSVREALATEGELFRVLGAMLEEVREILYPARVGVGYRTRDAILLYLWHWRQDGLRDIYDARDALDFCLLQKVLPRISGTGERMDEALERLESWLRAESSDARVGDDDFSGPYKMSAERVSLLRAQLHSEGAVNALAL